MAAFAVYVLLSPAAGDGLAGDLAGPLYRFLAGATAAVPVGDPRFRVALVCAAAAAIAVWASARLVIELCGDDGAAIGGAGVCGVTLMFAPALFMSAMRPAVWAVLAAALAVTLLLMIRVVRGAGAGCGLGLALALGLGVGIHPLFVVLWPVCGAVFLVLLRRGARWPLLAPAMTLLAAALACAPVVIASTTPLAGVFARPDFGPVGVAVGAAARNLGFIALTLAAGGAASLVIGSSQRWILVAHAFMVMGQLAAVAVLLSPVLAHPGAGVAAALVGCVLAGAGAARLCRAGGRWALFFAVPVALMSGALPALTSLGLIDRGWGGAGEINPRDVRQVEIVDGEVSGDGPAEIPHRLERDPEDQPEHERGCGPRQKPPTGTDVKEREHPRLSPDADPRGEGAAKEQLFAHRAGDREDEDLSRRHVAEEPVKVAVQ